MAYTLKAQGNNKQGVNLRLTSAKVRGVIYLKFLLQNEKGTHNFWKIVGCYLFPLGKKVGGKKLSGDSPEHKNRLIGVAAEKNVNGSPGGGWGGGQGGGFM